MLVSETISWFFSLWFWKCSLGTLKCVIYCVNVQGWCLVTWFRLVQWNFLWFNIIWKKPEGNGYGTIMNLHIRWWFGLHIHPLLLELTPLLSSWEIAVPPFLSSKETAVPFKQFMPIPIKQFFVLSGTHYCSKDRGCTEWKACLAFPHITSMGIESQTLGSWGCRPLYWAMYS